MRTRAVLVAVVAAAVSVAGVAPAQGATLVDDTFAEFAAAPPSATTWVVEPGAVRLTPGDLAEGFEGPALPGTLTAVPWAPAGTAAVGSGVLTVDGARVHPAAVEETAPQVMEFRATLGDAAFRHVGFGLDFNDLPWAMFSTGGGALPTGFYARTRESLAGSVDEAIAVDPLVPHDYRIEWSPAQVRYFVDGTLVASHDLAIAGPMRPVASDLAEGSGAVTVDWLGVGPHPAAGVFESRVHDAGDARAVWDRLTATTAGGTVTFATRSGTTAVPDATWSAWEAIAAGGAIASPIGRYIQYRATMSGAPALDRVELGYEVDTVAPDAVVDGVDVSGTTASVRFSSPAADVDRFECRLDQAGAAFATCASPTAFPGLASGSHTVLVRAIDRAGNAGPAAQRQFTIADPPALGGGDPAPPPAEPGPLVVQDATAPAVAIPTRSARATRSGIVVLRASCPADETSCRVTVRLKQGRTTSRARTVTIAGGKRAALRIRLPKAIRTLLTERRRLRASVLVAARDAAGNLHTSTKRLILTSRS